MPTPILRRAAQVAIETEGTAGTAETLVAADVHFRVADPVFNAPLEVYQQNLLTADLSELADLMGNQPVDITFSTLLAGSGAAATPPGWSEIMIHSGFLETVTATPSVTYTPETPTTTAPATIGVWFGASTGTSGRLFIAKGCRPSSLTLQVNPGQPVMMTTTWRGCFQSAEDASAYASPTYDTTVPPIARNLGLSIGSWTPLLKSMTININNTLAQVDNPAAASEASGISRYEITSRRVEGSIDFLGVLKSDKDWIADLGANTLAAFTMTVGSAGGNKVTIDMPKFQFLPGTMGDSEGLILTSLGWKANRSSGNDEITITTL